MGGVFLTRIYLDLVLIGLGDAEEVDNSSQRSRLCSVTESMRSAAPSHYISPPDLILPSHGDNTNSSTNKDGECNLLSCWFITHPVESNLYLSEINS